MAPRQLLTVAISSDPLGRWLVAAAAAAECHTHLHTRTYTHYYAPGVIN